MSEPLEPDVFAEALELVRALRAHVDYLAISGASGVPRAEVPIGAALTEPPASLAPIASKGNALPSGAPAAPRPFSGVATQEPVTTLPDWLTSATQPEAKLRAAARTPPSEAPSNAPGVSRAVSANLSKDQRQARLQVLETEVRGCTRCGLSEKRTQTVFARGTGSSGLCFVGEGPGADEDAQGYPFVGAAGQLLDRMISAMGMMRDEVYVCNIVKCRPPDNRKPEPSEMRACMPYLEEQLDLLAPEVIVALGATAVEGLLGVSGGITRLRGKWKLYKGRVAVMPTFHPAYLLRAPSAKHDVWEDMQAVLRHLGRPVPDRGRRR